MKKINWVVSVKINDHPITVMMQDFQISEELPREHQITEAQNYLEYVMKNLMKEYDKLQVEKQESIAKLAKALGLD